MIIVQYFHVTRKATSKNLLKRSVVTQNIESINNENKTKYTLFCIRSNIYASSFKILEIILPPFFPFSFQRSTYVTKNDTLIIFN